MSAGMNVRLIGIFSLMVSVNAFGQVGISDSGPVVPEPRSVLDLSSVSKGFLLPRMTTQQMASIVPAPDGLLIYNTDSSMFYYFNGDVNGWLSLVPGNDTIGHICGNPFQDKRDGQLYNSVQIGTQCWMAENLNVGTRIAVDDSVDNNGIIEKFCYGNLESNCDLYGGLYTWDEAMLYDTIEGIQGICPEGWHFPTHQEWLTLSDHLGGSSIAGGKMKTTGTIEEGTGKCYSPNTGATNESGFTGLPAGLHYAVGYVWALGYHGWFWSSTQASDTYAYPRLLQYNYNSIYGSGASSKETGFSIRCVRND